MNFGFTGTQQGMTIAQNQSVIKFLVKNHPKEVHLGDCIGSDYQFFGMIMTSNYKHKELPRITTIGHIPDNDSKRAFCHYDEERVPKPYLERNKDIVEACDVLLATPYEQEQVLRSGTWATVRYSLSLEKPTIIFFPDGSVKDYNWLTHESL